MRQQAEGEQSGLYAETARLARLACAPREARACAVSVLHLAHGTLQGLQELPKALEAYQASLTNTVEVRTRWLLPRSSLTLAPAAPPRRSCPE
jgi:hypothetical protein